MPYVRLRSNVLPTTVAPARAPFADSPIPLAWITQPVTAVPAVASSTMPVPVKPLTVIPRIALPAGAQLIVDTQRLYHAVWHQGDEPRYCLITSWESGPALGAYIERYHGVGRVDSYTMSDAAIAQGEALAAEKRAARAAALAARGLDPTFGDGTMRAAERDDGMGEGMGMGEAEVLSEA